MLLLHAFLLGSRRVCKPSFSPTDQSVRTIEHVGGRRPDLDHGLHHVQVRGGGEAAREGVQRGADKKTTQTES